MYLVGAILRGVVIAMLFFHLPVHLSKANNGLSRHFLPANPANITGTNNEVPEMLSCNELKFGERLFHASSSTYPNRQIAHSFWMKDVFVPGVLTKFDFTQGQLIYDNDKAKLFGTVVVREGGAYDGTTWGVHVNFIATDIFNPKTEVGQSPELTETWIFYLIDNTDSYLFNLADPTEIITLEQRGPPFQIGIGAGNKDIDRYSGSAWFYWTKGHETGDGDINVNLDFACTPELIDCEDLHPGQKLYNASSSTTNGKVIHSFWLKDLYVAGEKTLLDFTEGQLKYDADKAYLYGTLRLTSNGGDMNGTLWGTHVEFDATDVVDPKIERGQGQDLIDTWIYYAMNEDRSYLYRLEDPNDFISLKQMGPPFQIGLGAGNKDNDEISASAWFYWFKGHDDGIGDININIEDKCPPEGAVSPVLECVDYIAEESKYIAHFGYLNENDETVIIPIGSKNKFTPRPRDRGQPFAFLPGRQIDVFQVEFDGSELVWTLTSPNGSRRTSTASDNPDQRCSTNPSASIADTGGDLFICPGETATIQINLLGDAPWTLVYGNGTDEFTVQIDNSPYILEVSQAGVYTLISVTDVHGNPGEVSGSATVVEHPIPTAVLSGEAQVCEQDEVVNLTVTLTGDGPWDLVYTDGTNQFQTVVQTSPHGLAVTGTGTYELVSVSDSHCPGTVDGTAQVSLIEKPTASVSGGGSLCDENQSVAVNFNLTGTGPWNLVYTDGTQQFNEVVQDPVYSITVNIPGIYEVLSITDANCEGLGDGSSVVVTDETPTATISGGGGICPLEEADIVFELTGFGPYQLTYTDGTDNFDIEISDSPFVLKVSQEGTYEIVEFRDNFCPGSFSGAATVTLQEQPTAMLSGGGEICDESESLDLTLTLTGTEPWSVVYTNGTDQFQQLVENSPYQLSVSGTGTYSLVSVEDTKCFGQVDGTAEVTLFEKATATVSGGGSLCDENQSVVVRFELTGTAPWDLIYTDGSQQFSKTVPTSPYEVQVNAPGIYEVVSIRDANCEGEGQGTSVIVTDETPTASVNGGGSICPGEEAEIVFDLQGFGPFKLSYTDGSASFDIETSDNPFILKVSQPGNYEITSFQDNFCPGNFSGSAVVDFRSQPTASISGGGEFCELVDPVTIEIRMEGEAPFSIRYSAAGTVVEASTDNNLIEIVTDKIGIYEILSFSDQNCEGQISGRAEISLAPSLEGNISTDEIYCEGDEINVISDFSDIGLSFQWTTNGSGQLVSPNAPSTNYIPSDNDEELTFQLEVSNSCERVTLNAETRVIRLNPGFSIDPNPGEEPFIAQVLYTFTAEETEADSYEWNFGDGDTGTGQSIAHAYESTGQFRVTLMLDKEGCTGSQEISIAIESNRNLYVPNVFSPDAVNAENQVVKVYGEGISDDDFSFEIYNRWGQQVYQTSSFSMANTRGWDGVLNGEVQGNGVFTYVLRGEFLDGETFETTGTITLISD